jgi:hypothetical protein
MDGSEQGSAPQRRVFGQKYDDFHRYFVSYCHNTE